tara:strand:+ start:956 stop:1705 length:750 start_codon:yes stop_codon:yes gene_type:complete
MTNNNMIFIANWKMNGEKRHISDINKTIKFSKISKNKKNQIIYCPPFTLISIIKNKLKNTNIKVGAQNIHQLNDYGAFTGSVNSKLIKSVGCDYVIIGHSEIRNQENDSIINKKIQSALKEKLKVIFCIGETYKEKKNNRTLKVLKKQITVALKNVKKINNIIFAYEPRWAIGSGKIPKIPELTNNFNGISKIVNKLKKKQKFKIIYGGSVNSKNVSELKKINDLKGFLIGSASLRAKNFIDIIKKSTN